MRIGLDLDNTLACYDATFAGLAANESGLPADLPRTKIGLRRHLRDTGRESRWTELQGEAYGPGMAQAQPFPGAVEFMLRARALGHELVIISQRSPRALAGAPHDLHASARQWIADHLRDAAGPLFGPASLFLEPDRDAKVARIAACGCDAYVDDLPEVLGHPRFPAATRRYWFHPDASAPSLPQSLPAAAQEWAVLGRWRDFTPWSPA